MIELLRKRRSIRKYTGKAIDKNIVGLLEEALLRAPSSRNFQPWEFIFVDEPELLAKLSQSKEHGSSFVDKAALAVVVCGDPAKSDVWVEDCSIAAILVQITAQSLGLGSCWIQIRERGHNKSKTAEQYLQKLLGIPGNIKVESIISIGYPDEKKEPVPKDKLDYTKIRYNRY